MAFNTFGATLAYDPASRRGIAGTAAKIVDASNGIPVETFDMEGNPAPVITNASGYVDYFKVDDSVSMVEVTFGYLTMLMVAIELMAAARDTSDSATASQIAAEAAAAAAIDAAVSASGASWYKGPVPNSTDFDTFAGQGRYYIRLAEDIATMTSMPAEAGPGWGEFLISPHGMKEQRWTNYGSNREWKRVTGSTTQGTLTFWDEQPKRSYVISESTAALDAAITDATSKYGGLPARLTAVEQRNAAQDMALTQGLDSAANDATWKANTAKTDAIADATTKYGELPKQVLDLTQGRQLLDHQMNNLVELGRWRETMNGEATPANNHPFPYISDIEVYPIGSVGGENVQQKVFGASTFGGGFATRSKYKGTWSAWQIYRTEAEAVAKAKALLDSAVVQGTQLLDPQLNNATTFGRFRQTSNGNATPANNYPFPYISDIEVYPIASLGNNNIQQKVYGATTFGGGMAVRSRYNGTWSAWDIYQTEAKTLAKVTAMISAALPTNAIRTFPITLSFHASTSVDTRTSVQARIAVKLPATSKRWRVHFRNRNDRVGTLYPGALAFTGVGIGKHALGAGGALTGNTVGVPTTVSGPATTAANGAEWVTPWVESYPLEAHEEYLLPYGFTCAPQENQAGYGTAWTTDNAGDVFVAAPSGAVQGQPLLDVWIEAEFAADVPAVAYFGSSSAVGIGADYVGRQSFANAHALAHGVIPVMYAHSGSAMRIWNTSTTKDQKWLRLSRPDALLWTMGGNDLSDAGDLATMQARFNAAWPIITNATSTNVHLVTMTGRYGAANTPEFTALRHGYNGWLETLPGNAVACWDINERVTNSADDSLLEKYAALPDTGHMNAAGYARAATAIAAPLAVLALA